MNEIWKTIDEYPNYQVSNMGNVKSLNYKRTGNEKILKQYNHTFGYKIVSLSQNGKIKKVCVHRLVAMAFIPNPENKPEIDHINTDPIDNRVCNLRWVTSKENSNNTITKNKYSQMRKIMIGKLNPKSKIVLQFDKKMNFIKRWNSLADVKRQLNIIPSNILKVINGIRTHTGGYKWGYADDYERIPFKVFDLEIYRKKVA